MLSKLQSMSLRKVFEDKHIFSTKEVVLKCILGFQWKMFGFYLIFMARLFKLHSMCAEAVFEGKQAL